MPPFDHPRLPSGLGPDQIVRRLAGRQHDAVSRRQLLAASLTGHQIDRRIARGTLATVHRGVFVLTAAPLGTPTRFAAALLASGPDAVLSHRSAAHVHGMMRGDRGPVHVTTTHRSRARTGIVVHRSDALDAAVTTRDRMPCTTVARTLIDLAGAHGPEALRRAWTTLAGRRTLDVRAVQRELLRSPDRAGNTAVRLLLAEHRDTVSGTTRSFLEAQAVAMCSRHGLPMPAVNAFVTVDDRVYEADLLWHRQRVIVELDTWGTHGHELSFREDRQRDFALQLAGWVTVRLLEADLTVGVAQTAHRLRTLLSGR